MVSVPALVALLGLLAWLPAGGLPVLEQQEQELQLQRVRGQAFFEERQYGESEAAFARVVEASEATVEDWLNLALARYEQNEDGAALEALERAEELGSDHPGVFYLKGLVHRRGDDREAALRAFRRAAELDPSDPAIRYNLGSSLESTGEEEAAVAEYDAVLEMGFDIGLQHYASALYKLGFIQMRSGQREVGQEKLMRHRELAQSLSQAQRAPAALEAGRYKRVRVPTVSLGRPSPELASRVVFGSRPVAGVGPSPLIERVDGRWALIDLGPDGGLIWDEDAQVRQPLPAGVGAAGDFDRDGHPDLVVASEGFLRLYRAVVDGTGRAAFEPVEATGLPEVESVSSLTWVDTDHDGTWTW